MTTAKPQHDHGLTKEETLPACSSSERELGSGSQSNPPHPADQQGRSAPGRKPRANTLLTPAAVNASRSAWSACFLPVPSPAGPTETKEPTDTRSSPCSDAVRKGGLRSPTCLPPWTQDASSLPAAQPTSQTPSVRSRACDIAQVRPRL